MCTDSSGPTDQRKEPWRLGREKAQDSPQHLLGPSQEGQRSSSPGLCTLDRPSPLLLHRVLMAPKRGSFCRGTSQEPGAACAARGVLLERSTALGREALETPVGMRALKARALLFLKTHKGALFPDTGPKCWLQLSAAQFPSVPELVSPSSSIMFALSTTNSPKLFCALISRSTLSRVWVHLSFLKLRPQPRALLVQTPSGPGNNKAAAGKSYGLIKPRPSVLPVPTLRALIKPFHHSRAAVSAPVLGTASPADRMLYLDVGHS